MRKILLFFILIWQNLSFSQSDNYCRGSAPEIITNNPLFPCTQDWQLFTPSIAQDTAVIDVAVILQNGTALPSALINQYQDSTFYHWIWNLNHKYANIQLAVANVGNTPYIPDTRIRFRLVGVYKVTGGTPYPAGLNSVKLNIYAGVDGNGDNGGGAEAIAASTLDLRASVNFYLPATDFVRDGLSMSGTFRTGQLAHEMGHIFGLMHPDGGGQYEDGCAMDLMTLITQIVAQLQMLLVEPIN